MLEKIPFLGKVPFALLLLIAGGILTLIGTIAFVMNYAALNMAGFFYGIPMFLGGIAFKITELKPVPITQPLTAEVEALRESQANDTQKKIFEEVTRYRYGERAHLIAALKFLGLSPTDEERPEIVGIYETAVDGAYALILGFDSPMIKLQQWQGKQEKMSKFFGPDVRVEVAEPEEELIKVSIISTPKSQQTEAIAA
ncbi:DUF2854 domain-containing protein [filamentous cyanobacterium LEGE 11480]|uniref:DUF2854 domain-containing protein n=1 Tax=Romeriopsis navalis LEGE 11480 TaxID=2777977 RepID=A0A928VMY4_9CYAN|nr:DUF2854 domain-containing protein [Romeriopsis navalis]MBE9029362.1 DUF2854 domain-containing protein [Romeriopsis navalis LEGE 11480]